VRLRVVGQIDAFEPRLRELIERAQEQSAGNTRLNLTICASYGGRWDIVQAAQAYAAERAAQQQGVAQQGTGAPAVAPAAVAAAGAEEEAFGRHLSMAFAPDPDLLIRTGGEQRISNFLIWQCAYAELYFTDVLWPDFQGQAFADALSWYAQRERRFGRTSEQIRHQG